MKHDKESFVSIFVSKFTLVIASWVIISTAGEIGEIRRLVQHEPEEWEPIFDAPRTAVTNVDNEEQRVAGAPIFVGIAAFRDGSLFLIQTFAF